VSAASSTAIRAAIAASLVGLVASLTRSSLSGPDRVVDPQNEKSISAALRDRRRGFGPETKCRHRTSVVLALANAIIVLLSGAIGSGTRRFHAPTESV
jgi:hypothetical protein